MLIEQPYEKAKLTYAQVRSILNLSDDAIFKGVRYSSEDKKAIETKTTHDGNESLSPNFARY